MDKHSKDVTDSQPESREPSKKSRIGFTPALAAQVRLFPSRNTPKAMVEYVNGTRRIRIMAAPGELPAGKLPRLILLWLTGEIQRNSEDVDAATRTVYAGSSFRGFMKRLGIEVNGQSRDRVREQLKRFASTTIDIQETVINVGERGVRFSIADAWQLEFVSHPGQDDSLFPNFVTLSQGMWDQLKDFPVPVDLNMIAKLGKSALALDVYMWATYRVNSLRKPIYLTWQQLYDQFSAGEIANMKLFRERFRDAVADVTRVYPDLHIDVSSSKQIVLYPSLPSVLPSALKSVQETARKPVEKDSKSRGDSWFTVPTLRGNGRVYGTPQAFSPVQAEQHLYGVIPLGKACVVCGYDPRNEEFHASLSLSADEV